MEEERFWFICLGSCSIDDENTFEAPERGGQGPKAVLRFVPQSAKSLAHRSGLSFK